MAEGLLAPFPKREWCDPGDIPIDQPMQQKIIGKEIPLNSFFSPSFSFVL